jgi:tRNA A-37 threonylcarbamoyl transferase component Bud32/tetratricopeptide (TPR) repeat protein
MLVQGMGDDLQLLFREVSDLSPRERQQYFDHRGVPPHLRAEVESLLGFDTPHADSLTGHVAAAALQFLDSDAGPGEGGRCGPYQLVRLLGRGGMGAVFLAQRADGEVEQRVAIKFVRNAADEPAFRDRFLRERQILASFSHPGIARLLDAGHTVLGQPYLVMEYIDGIPIDVFAGSLDLRAKLRLFLLVCDAISYAHRNLVIHRDLKPSNILVEAGGQPKLLDFGIARILFETGRDEADLSQTKERMLTPDYASPEQVRGGAHSTATDVYSLAAVLYRLLTGRSPHTPPDGHEESIEARICSMEPIPPSRWNRALPRDLDFVLAKALRKEPEQRYTAVDALASDLRAVLDSRPVEARSGSAWYKTRKFVRRYWVPVAAAALVVASLSAGLYMVNRERAIAQRRFLEVRQLANKLFDIDALARELPGSTKTRQLIVDTSLQYLGRLAADVQGDPGLALEVGNAYMRVARVQGVPIGANLGQLDRAEQNLRIADGLIHSVLQVQPQNRTALLRAAQVAHDRMLLAGFKNRPEEALQFAGASAGWLEKFNAVKSDGAEDSAILNTYLNVANRYVSDRQFDKALSLTGRAVELSRTYDFPAYRGTFQWVRAKIFQRQGNLEEALQAIQESVTLLDPGPKKAGHGQITNLAQALVYEGRILGDDNGISLDRYEEAAKPLQRAFDIADGLVRQDANDHNDRGSLANAGIPLAGTLRHSDPRRALEVYDHTLGYLTDIQADVHLQTYAVRLLAGSSYPLRRMGRAAEARQRLDAAFERLRQLKFYPADKVETGSEAEEALRALADHEAETGNLPRALQVYQELLDRIAAAKPEPEINLEDATHLSKVYASMAFVERRARRADLASALDARRLELWRRWEQKLPNNPFVVRRLAESSDGGR